MAGEPRAHLLVIHTDQDCLIGGEAAACRRVLAKAGSPVASAGKSLAVHCPEMAAYAEGWRRLHLRPTRAPQATRIYANAIGDAYAPSEDRVAQMLLDQASTSVDFPRTIRKAWADGVRIFIEHGPPRVV